MLKVGLTGGIASGKSTVAAMLRDRDVPVLDADTLGHELLEPGQAAYREVVHDFGQEVLDANGKVDRAKLGAFVFSDPRKLARLNEILHPRILDVVRNWFVALDEPDGPELAVVEAALIIEAGFHRELDKLIVCWCWPQQQLERLQGRGLSAEEAQQRIAAQMSMDEKRRLADEAIDCSGSIEETERQLEIALAKLKHSSASRRNIS
jgi:dephospho-CoA kinase